MRFSCPEYLHHIPLFSILLTFIKISFILVVYLLDGWRLIKGGGRKEKGREKGEKEREKGDEGREKAKGTPSLHTYYIKIFDCHYYFLIIYSI